MTVSCRVTRDETQSGFVSISYLYNISISEDNCNTSIDLVVLTCFVGKLTTLDFGRSLD